MRYSSIVALALASTVSAHTRMFSVWVNGKDGGDLRSKAIRTPPDNSPVTDLSSPAMACGTKPAAVPDFVKAAAGDKLGFEWFHNTRGDDIIDLSHKGPITTWVAPFTEDDGTGPIWTKIDEEGLSGGKWAVENLVANKGIKEFTLPADLKAGKYLVRQEVLGLHEATRQGGAQFYPSCVQVEVSGSGSAVPTQNFDINKGYQDAATGQGIVFDIYNNPSTYPIPGPAVAALGAGSGSGSAPAPAPTATGSAPSATTSAATGAQPTKKPCKRSRRRSARKTRHY